MPYLIIAGIASAVLIVNAIFATLPGYRVAPVFLIPLLLIVYLLRKKLDISPLGYGFFAAAVLLHDLGAYGYYQHCPAILTWLPWNSFDVYVHFYFALAGTVILHRAMRRHLPWKPWQVSLATMLFIMGVGAIHEIMEYCSTLVLGEERGMIKKSSYRFDTERDLTSNLCGVIVAITAITIYRALKRKTTVLPLPDRPAVAANESTGNESVRNESV